MSTPAAFRFTFLEFLETFVTTSTEQTENSDTHCICSLETAFPFPVSISVPPVFLDIGLVRVLKRWPGAKIASHRGKQDRNEHLFTMEKDFHSLLGGAVTDLLLSSRSLLPFCWPMWRRSNRDWSALGSKEAIGSALEVSSQLPSAVLSLLSLLCTFSEWAKTLQRKKVLALLCFNF